MIYVRVKIFSEQMKRWALEKRSFTEHGSVSLSRIMLRSPQALVLLSAGLRSVLTWNCHCAGTRMCNSAPTTFPWTQQKCWLVNTQEHGKPEDALINVFNETEMSTPLCDAHTYTILKSCIWAFLQMITGQFVLVFNVFAGFDYTPHLSTSMTQLS